MEQMLTEKKIVVLAENLYEDLELGYPVLRLREEGATVMIAGTGPQEYRGKHGYPVTADTAVDRISSTDVDAVIIPGGYAPDRLRRSAAAVRSVREAFEREKAGAA